jgi:hypothetical protein
MSALFNHYRPMQQEQKLVPAFAFGKCDEQGSWKNYSINGLNGSSDRISGCRSCVGDV